METLITLIIYIIFFAVLYYVLNYVLTVLLKVPEFWMNIVKALLAVLLLWSVWAIIAGYPWLPRIPFDRPPR